MGNPSVLRQVAFDLDETLVVSQRDYIFEKMCLVASQLPLTREPRKECEANGSAELAWIVKTVRLGKVKLRKSGKVVGSAKGGQSLSLATGCV